MTYTFFFKKNFYFILFLKTWFKRSGSLYISISLNSIIIIYNIMWYIYILYELDIPSLVHFYYIFLYLYRYYLNYCNIIIDTRPYHEIFGFFSSYKYYRYYFSRRFNRLENVKLKFIYTIYYYIYRYLYNLLYYTAVQDQPNTNERRYTLLYYICIDIFISTIIVYFIIIIIIRLYCVKSSRSTS